MKKKRGKKGETPHKQTKKNRNFCTTGMRTLRILRQRYSDALYINFANIKTKNKQQNKNNKN